MNNLHLQHLDSSTTVLVYLYQTAFIGYNNNYNDYLDFKGGGRATSNTRFNKI